MPLRPCHAVPVRARARASYAPALLALLATLALPAPRAWASVTVPTDFVVEDYCTSGGFTDPTGMAFLPGGRLLVAEKGGRVWIVTNGVKSATPLVDLQNEVLDNGDRGLLDVAVDPNYVTNRYVYLLYTVDPDSDGVDDDDDAYGRLTRYQVSATDSMHVVASSRTILMGTTWSTGPCSGSPSHTIGTMRWGSDGTLLVSSGEGAQFNSMDIGGQDPGLFTAGRVDPAQDIGAFRAQDLGALGGKVLRLDPATGRGLASNPYYDGDVTHNRSKVWCYGLRNPFRFNVRPGTGSSNPASGSPGTLYIGDVGWGSYEEMDVAASGGLNFGWPCYEGLIGRSEYQAAHPSRLGCSAIGTSQDPANPTDPLATWHHSNGANSSPPGIVGNSSIGGVFYTGTRYPSLYRNQYFFGDYGWNWIRVARVDANNQLLGIVDFAQGADGPVDFAIDPSSGDIVYVSIIAQQVRRIRYVGPTGNADPVAQASGAPVTGTAPMTVDFSSAGTFDPDNDPMTLSWSFGDGQGTSATNPSHTYASAGSFDAILTADDGKGGIGRDTVRVIVLSDLNFPKTPIVDNFNRANAPLTTPWVDPVNNLAGLSVSSNQLRQACCAYGSPLWGATRFGADQEAYVRISTLTAGAPEHDLMLKLQAPSYSAAHVEVRYDDSTKQIDVSTYDPEANWAGWANIPATLVSGDQLGARALSNGTVQVFKNGTLLGTSGTGTWPYGRQGGYIGLTLDGATSSRLDDFGGGTVALSNDTKPHATILSPLDHTFYAAGDTIRFTGTGTDAEQPANTLVYGWSIMLHHNTHIHPDFFTGSGTSWSVVGQNHDDGTGVWMDCQLRVTDNAGMTDTAHVALYPEIDLTPSNLVVSPADPGTVAPATYSFTLANLGRMPAPFSHWRLVAGATMLAEGDTLVPAQSAITVSRSVPPMLPAGTYDLRAVADTLAAVVETDETNNAVTTTLTVTSGGATGVDPPVTPLALSEARPNPTGSAALLELSLPRPGPVEVEVLDVQGRQVWSMSRREFPAGPNTLRWPGIVSGGRPVTPGIYLVRVSAGGARWVRRVAVVR